MKLRVIAQNTTIGSSRFGSSRSKYNHRFVARGLPHNQAVSAAGRQNKTTIGQSEVPSVQVHAVAEEVEAGGALGHESQQVAGVFAASEAASSARELDLGGEEVIQA